jgi:7,8-dihydropterin-6-yl-methyl-4-(beta-D-ribofuranosyl)aminobenzene 5'-phosphate synthase
LAAGFLSANKGKLKKNLPFFIGGEDCFCTRERAFGPYGALDRQAILNADLALMMAEGPAIIADHGFTTGKIAQVSSEKPLQPSKEKVGIVNGFGCFPDKMSPAKNTGTFIPDDFEHEIGTAIPPRRADQGRDCGAAEVQRVAENAPRWPDLN